MNFRFINRASCILLRNLLYNKQTVQILPITVKRITACSLVKRKCHYHNNGNTKKENAYGDNKNNSSNGESKANVRSRPILWAGAAAFSIPWFKSANEEHETPEDKLINTIKGGMLFMQREQYDKAEQMLHLALRMAQDLQSTEGITYIYDVMANLAMERAQYAKAEKLFTDVMRRLLTDGFAQDSPQILHISAKLAHMAQLQGDLDKSMLGFNWVMTNIESLLKSAPEDENLQELLGLTKNWYGQLLMKLGKYDVAKKAFSEAHQSLLRALQGEASEEVITILNNLSVACTNLEDFPEARKYINQALDMAKKLKETTQEGILRANLGLIYLREGMMKEAQSACSLAYRLGKQSKNHDAVEQAEYCLSEIKLSMNHTPHSTN